MKKIKETTKMRNVIRYKIVILFLLLTIAFSSLFYFYVQSEIKKDELTYQKEKLAHKKEELSYIKNELIKQIFKFTVIFIKHHNEVFESNGHFIDPQSYLGTIRDVSAFAKGTKLKYIKSYIKVDDNFLLTSTSATDKEFTAKSYGNYGDVAKRNIEILSRAYSAGGEKEIFMDDKLAIQLEVDGNSYVILSKIDREKIVLGKKDKISEDNYMAYFALLTIIMFVILYMLLSALAYVHKEIIAIDVTLRDFFDYMLKDKKIENIKYIEYISNDQLGVVSKNINSNIKEIIENTLVDKENKVLDDNIILELIEALDLTLVDSFKQEVKSNANNENLNTLKNRVNSMIPRVDKTLSDINRATEEYINKNYIPSLEKGDHRDTTLKLINNLNQLGKNNSSHLVEVVEHLIDMNGHAKLIDSYIDNNIYTLNNVLSSIKKVVQRLEGDYKFAFEFDNSIKVIKQENIYVNNLLDNFGDKYEASIALMDDLKSGVFDNDIELFKSRVNSVIKDSSIRDNESQKVLINRVRDLTANNIVEVTTEKVRGLLRLLLEELLKDIRYSLYLIENKVEKLSSDSSSRLSSFEAIGNISKEIRERVVQDLENIQKLQEISSDQINKTDDVKYDILDQNEFIGKKEINKFLLHKGEL